MPSASLLQCQALLRLLLLQRGVLCGAGMLCEGYWDPAGLHHSGFYCPRLSDPPDQSYCCQQGEHSLKDCCNRSDFQSIMNINLSKHDSAELVHSRRPLSLVAVLLYGALVLFLISVDFLWFCRVRGLTVTAALRKYFTCPHWASSLIAPRGNQPQRYHGNRNPDLRRQRTPQSPPRLHGNWSRRAPNTDFSSNQNTELSHLDPEVSSRRTEDDVRWPED